VQPDNVHQFFFGGQFFNCPFEIDRNTETLDGFHPKAWRQRILAYEAYQDLLLATWKRDGRRFAAPRLRVAFLTTSAEHAYNFLTLARELARNRDRHLFYAATLDEYLQDTNPLTSPILIDHDGRWQSLVNLHPTAAFHREPVQLPRQKVAPLLAV
jgi:hypothetical protein